MRFCYRRLSVFDRGNRSLWRTTHDMRAGYGHFVQVLVDRMRGKPAAIPSKVPSCLQRLQYLRDPVPSDRLKRCG